jgi:hypothetical protein
VKSFEPVDPHTSHMAQGARAVWLVAVLACFGCSDPVHPPPPGDASLPGISPDASSDTLVDTNVDTGSSDARDAADQTEVLDSGSPCSAFCDCMTATCASEASYPFPSETACISWCSKLSDTERACYATFCAEAALTKAATIKTHDCDHATGAFGLAECT